MHTLSIQKLSARIGGVEILKNISLVVQSGELHVLMGQNGSGKSTLAATLMGRPDIMVTNGKMTFDGIDLLQLTPEKRARAGLFLGFQNPPALPGVSISQAMRLSLRARAAERGELFDNAKFSELIRSATQMLYLDDSFLSRGLNDGLSGGEKKRMELLQLVLLQPRFAILDEIDSGLDIDGLASIKQTLDELIQKHNTGCLLITHYPSLLEIITPHRVHVMNGGSIAASGGSELARSVKERGYAQFYQS